MPNNLRNLLASVLCLMLSAAAQAADHMHGAAPSRQELGSTAAFAPDGTLWVAGKQGEHVVVQSSRDEGRTWSDPVVVNARPEPVSADGENRPKLAFGPDGALLVSWTRPLGKPYSGEIRFARSPDGRAFSEPVTVHRDRQEITHRFDSLFVTPGGKVLVAWIDKRDLEAAKAARQPYRGAAIYAAVSADQGRTFAPETKVADSSCECCRIAMAADRDGAPLLLWRHVFAPNERDHALARLTADGTPESVRRATFDRWKIDACPHHGPSLAVDDEGTRHAVWFNDGKVFYGRLVDQGGQVAVAGQRPVGGPRAAHADLAVADSHVVIAWKEFDGERTQLLALQSADRGQTFAPLALATTEGASDQPRVLVRQGRLYAFWRTEKEGLRLYPLP